MPFIVLHVTYTADRKVRYVQFGDECATLDEARKVARWPNLRGPIIVDLAKVERLPERLVLAAETPVRGPRKAPLTGPLPIMWTLDAVERVNNRG